MNMNSTISDYLDKLASSDPTPGGGNVAALCGVLASALGIMVTNLTIGKKKYAEVETEMKDIHEKVTVIKHELIDLANKDNEAFDSVMEAFKLPKNTEEEKNIRMKQIEDKTYNAGVVPFNVIKKCNELLPYLKTCAEKGNAHSLSDAGVGISLIETAAHGALLNVMINCSGLNDKEKANQLLTSATNAYDSIKLETKNLLENIVNKLK